jgi:hypothetical protein
MPATPSHLSLLQARPPQDGIPFNDAIKLFRLANQTVWKLIKAGDVKAGAVGRMTILVSRGDCERAVADAATRGRFAGAPPEDGEPVDNLAREFEIHNATIRDWCRWKTHPGLGRKLRSGTGQYEIEVSDGRKRSWRGLLASRADVKACVDAIKKPFHRAFPGMPGVWIADGIFRHNEDDKKLWFTEKYVYDNRQKYGISPRSLGLSCYRSKLDPLKVTWPRPGPRERWTVTVFSEESLARLVDWRNGKVDSGSWLKDGLLWKDAEGIWYSSQQLADMSKQPLAKIHDVFRDSGLVTKFKLVPSAHKSGRGGRSAMVHHESDIRTLLGIAEEKAPEPSSKLNPKNDTERAILKLVESTRLPGHAIASRLGLEFNHVRRVLARMRTNGLLDNNHDGYLDITK